MDKKIAHIIFSGRGQSPRRESVAIVISRQWLKDNRDYLEDYPVRICGSNLSPVWGSDVTLPDMRNWHIQETLDAMKALGMPVVDYRMVQYDITLADAGESVTETKLYRERILPEWKRLQEYIAAIPLNRKRGSQWKSRIYKTIS